MIEENYDAVWNGIPMSPRAQTKRDAMRAVGWMRRNTKLIDTLVAGLPDVGPHVPVGESPYRLCGWDQNATPILESNLVPACVRVTA